MSTIDAVLSNQTVTTSGSYVFRAGAVPEVVLVYNISGPFAADSGIIFTLVQVDPANETTPIGDSVFTDEITGAGAGTLKIETPDSATVLASWTLVGTSVTGVTASIFKQDFPSAQTVKLADKSGTPYTAAKRNNATTLAVESRPLESLLAAILSELKAIRSQLVTITDEDDPL